MSSSSSDRPPRRRWRPFWGHDVDADVDAELGFHLEMRARDFERLGATPEDAARAARERFGPVDQIGATLRDHDRRRARQHRRMESMGDLWRDLTLAVRGLRRAPGFTMVAIVTLALGIGATTAIFSVVYAAILRPLPYPGGDRIVDLTEIQAGQRGTVSPPNFTDWRDQSRTLTTMSAWSRSSAALTGGGRSEQLDGASVTTGFFDVLGVRPAIGRTFSAAEWAYGGPKAVVIADALWRRRFGSDPAIVGRSIQLDGEAHEVVGVMPPGAGYPADAALWRPLAFSADELATQRGAHYLRVLGRVSPAATLEGAQAELASIGARLAAQFPDQNGGTSVAVRTLRESLVGNVRPALYLLSGAVLLLLLLACANVANLLLARAVQREREQVIRVALGAGRGRLVRQLLAESMVLGVAGGMVGLLLAIAGTGALTATLQVARPALATARVDLPVLLFALGASLLTSIAFGLLPAVASSRVTQLEGVLRGTAPGASGWGRGRRMRGALVAGQLAAAVLLLTGAALLARSFVAMQQVELGFQPRGVWSFAVSLPDARYEEPERTERFYAELLERVRAVPGVESAGITAGLPLSGMSYSISVHSLDGRQVPQDVNTPSTQVRIVSDGYLRTMGMRLEQGRAIEPTDRSGAPPVVVVSRALADELWPGEEALGHRLELGTSFGLGRGRAGGTVVGVVSDVRGVDVRDEPLPTIYLPHQQMPVGTMALVARGANPVALRRPLAAAVVALDPELPLYNERTLDAVVADAVAEPRLYAVLLVAFAGTALVLAAVGVYGVVALAVGHRTREIGVRMALGARRAAIVGLVLRQGVATLAVGIGAGLVAAWWAARALTSLLYGVSATDPVTFVAVPIFLALVALAATAIPARRATSVSPTEALRSE